MQTEWSRGPLTQSPGWRRFEWGLFIAICALLIVSAVSYRHGISSSSSVLLNLALVALTGGPLIPERYRILRWIALAAAFVFLGFSFRAI